MNLINNEIHKLSKIQLCETLCEKERKTKALASANQFLGIRIKKLELDEIRYESTISKLDRSRQKIDTMQ